MNDFARIKKQQSVFRDHRVDRFILCPKHWHAFKSRAKLSWQGVKFETASAAKLPNNKRGVYTFVVQPDVGFHPSISYLLYVGMVDTSDFRTRFKSYLGEPKKPKPRDHILYMIDRWSKHMWFYYAPVSAKTNVELLEDKLLIAMLPPMNRKFPAKVRNAVRMTFS